MNDGTSLLADLYSEIVSLQNWSDLQSASLPIQRELIDIKFELCQLLTDMLEAELNQISEKNESNLVKENAIRVTITLLVHLFISIFSNVF